MFNRENSRLVEAVATTEGKTIVDEAHMLVRFEYTVGESGETQLWDLDVSEKVETSLGDDSCYYVPVFEVNKDDMSRGDLVRVVLLDDTNEIATGKSIFKRATLPPRKSNLSEKLWKEHKDQIKHRQLATGGAVGGAAVLGASGVVAGTIAITKWVQNRR